MTAPDESASSTATHAPRSSKPLVVGIVVAAVLVAIASGLWLRNRNSDLPVTSTSGDAAALPSFLDIVRATEDASSYTMTMADARGGTPVTIEYQAPDRYRRQTSAPSVPPGVPGPPTEEIVIGMSTYSDNPLDPGTWTVQSAQQLPGAANAGIFAWLRLSTSATRTPDGFTFAAPYTSGSATVRGGFLESVTINQAETPLVGEGGVSEPRTMTVTFSKINSSPAVTAPPADKVTPESIPPVCGPEPTDVPVCVDLSGRPPPSR